MEHLSLCVNSIRGTWREGPLLGTTKDMLSKALEMGVCFHRGPFLGNMGDAPFLGPSRDR